MFRTLTRFLNMGKDKVDSWLDENEDNVAVAKRELDEAKKDCAQLVVKYGKCKAQLEKDRKDYEAAQSEVDDYTRIAEQAYKAGNMEDAQSACEKQAYWENEAKIRKETYDISRQVVEDTQNSINEYKRNIDSIQSSISSLEAKSAQADAIELSAEMQPNGLDSHMDNISKAEQKINARLEAAKAKKEMSTVKKDDLKDKYSGTSSSVDDKMASLRAKFGDK